MGKLKLRDDSCKGEELKVLQEGLDEEEEFDYRMCKKCNFEATRAP